MKDNYMVLWIHIEVDGLKELRSVVGTNRKSCEARAKLKYRDYAEEKMQTRTEFMEEMIRG